MINRDILIVSNKIFDLRVQMTGLIKERRLQEILQLIEQNQQATPGELSRTFDVSEITIRRDLRELADQGFLRRSHGGVLATAPKNQEPPVIQRMLYEKQVKETIARAAANRIKDGTTIFLGSGSTTTYIARNLPKYNRLTVVTNALNIGGELATRAGITVVVMGGLLNSEELSMVGHITIQGLHEVRLDKVIIGIPAIDIKAGLTNSYLPEVITDRTIIDMAPEVILVADHTKFGKISSAYLAPITKVTTLITDCQTDPHLLDQIRALGIEVVVAE